MSTMFRLEFVFFKGFRIGHIMPKSPETSFGQRIPSP